jgi:hypothetical protein
MCRPALLVLGMLVIAPVVARAQDEAPIQAAPDTTASARSLTQSPVPPESYRNEIAGEMTPGGGFDIIRTPKGSLNISVYGLFRYVNQLPADQTYTDHLGRERTVKTNNMINWHRTFVWLTGFIYESKFRYNISLWSLPTTQQTLLFGNLRYVVAKPLALGVGIGPNLTCRSTQGSWPYWASSDRQMGEEFTRGGFSSSFFITGEPRSRLFYTAALTNNLSQLGVTAPNDTRNMGVSASVWAMPTTGEFGPRGGFADVERHLHPATRFGISAGHSRESRYAALSQPPNATQIRLSDGVLPFDQDALAVGVTVQTLDYDEMAFDAGYKYKGFTFQGEFYNRRLSNFDAKDNNTGAPALLPLSSITDRAFMLEAIHMVVPSKLGLYVATSYVDDQFGRYPWEVAGGASFYPYGNPVWRLNLHVIHVEKSPTGSNFGFYTAGQTGTTISIGTDILL